MTQSKIESIEISTPVLLLEWWKPIQGFEGYYEVSCTGKIRRVGNVEALAGAVTRKGYRMAVLHKPGGGEKDGNFSWDRCYAFRGTSSCWSVGKPYGRREIE